MSKKHKVNNAWAIGKMGKVAIEIENLIKYIVSNTDFEEDGIAIVITCNEPDMANEMLEYLKSNVSIDFDSALEKAVAIREKNTASKSL